MITTQKEMVEHWDMKFLNRFGLRMREVFTDDIDSWSEDDLHKAYHEHLDEEFANKFGGA